MDKFNDCLVLILSYFLFFFSDLTPTPEDKYFIGWFFNGLFGIMVSVNVVVMVQTVVLNVMNKFKEMIFKCKEKMR